jgi:hypothetical protein
MGLAMLCGAMQPASGMAWLLATPLSRCARTRSSHGKCDKCGIARHVGFARPHRHGEVDVLVWEMMNFAAIDDNIASAVYGAIFAFRAPGSTWLRCNP